MYFVYIIESLADGDFYKGLTTNYLKRLDEHNNGESRFTASNLTKKSYTSSFNPSVLLSSRSALLSAIL